MTRTATACALVAGVASRGAAGNQANSSMHSLQRLAVLLLCVGLASGCSIVLPEVSTMPVVHNPFPQLSRVAVLPFFNLSDEPTVDGRKFALAYFAELQAVPGFEVVPVGVVEEMILNQDIDLSDPEDIRRLARLLDVDAIVVGAVTDYSPYYPPRCGMRVEWYTANPGYHEIPAGYGLPWGTPEEEYISPDIVFDAEMALAKAQMATQSPICTDPREPQSLPMMDAAPMIPSMPPASSPVAPPSHPASEDEGDLFLQPEPIPDPKGQESASKYDVPPQGFDIEDNDPDDPIEDATNDTSTASSAVSTSWRPVSQASYKVPMPAPTASPAADAIATGGAFDPLVQNNFATGLPSDWPDPRGFIPPGLSPVRPACMKNDGPVMTHTRIFLGNDPEFTTALAAYVDFRDDARFGGWRSYLERSDDFIRFCCHLHISEMLSARGGATETRVVRHWSDCR